MINTQSPKLTESGDSQQQGSRVKRFRIPGHKTPDDRVVQKCLELLEQGQAIEDVLSRYPEQAERLRGNLEAAAWLRGQRKTLDVRAGWVSASRSWLEAGVQHNGRRAWTRRALKTSRRLAYVFLALFIAAYLVLSGSRLAHAAQAWLPGDVLYPLKIGLEKVELLVTFDQDGRARLHIEFARQRLLEMQALIFENRYDQLEGVVNNFDQQVQQAVRGINEVAKDDRTGARNLSLDLQGTLSSQSRFVQFLAEIAPPEAAVQFKRLERISQRGISDLQE